MTSLLCPRGPCLLPRDAIRLGCSVIFKQHFSTHVISKKYHGLNSQWVPRDPHFLHSSLLFAESRTQNTPRGDDAGGQEAKCVLIPGSHNLLSRRSPQVRGILTQEMTNRPRVPTLLLTRAPSLSTHPRPIFLPLAHLPGARISPGPLCCQHGHCFFLPTE